jgi:glycosyltransferase involved in cell wall biosynthesis
MPHGLLIAESLEKPVRNADRVYLLVLSGGTEDAQWLIEESYPDCECVVLDRRTLREAGWRGQVNALWKIKGRALVFFVHSLAELQEPQLTVLSGFIHSCRSTVLADSSGRLLEYGKPDWLRILPLGLVSAVLDVCTFVCSWLFLMVLRVLAKPIEVGKQQDVDLDLAYLYPYPLDAAPAGGSLSHVRGFLGGMAASARKCEIFSGRPLQVSDFPLHVIPRKRKLFLFRESFALSYNLRFVRVVCSFLRNRSTTALYQRHGRFVLAGALLSRMLAVPLVLEYNASELRMAQYGDPVRFPALLRLCQDASLFSASVIVVVSEPLRQELIERGIPEKRILVNPNAVDPGVFHPDCGGRKLRGELNFATSDVVVAFVGTFSYWHGIRTLASAIRYLLLACDAEPIVAKLRFLLVGDGPLCSDAREALESVGGKRVLFTGLLPHDRIPTYLDAADILVSPHIPMPDGKPFFGSPTKLFEYMAMSKAIIASDLDQLRHVLRHDWSAWLVEPGNAAELASAILLLARDAGLRERLGENARATVVNQYTWEQNADRVLARVCQRTVRAAVSRP